MKLTEPYKFECFIPMRPQALQRVRVCRTGFSFTPGASRDAKSRIAAAVEDCLMEEGIAEPLDGVVEISITAVFEKPKCWWPGKIPTGGGDWDNHGKTVCDALNGVLYYDDRQIIKGSVIKEYGDAIGYKIQADISPAPEKPRRARKRVAA